MSDSAGFWGGGGGGNPYWPQGPLSNKPTPVGESIEGIITQVYPPEPQTDYNTGEALPGKFQVRIDLQTELRDPDVDDDEGLRTIYVKGWMTGAVTDALHKAGAQEPQKGAKLKVTYTGNAAPRRPGQLGAKQYSAEYTPSGGFFAAHTEAAPASNGDAPIPADPPKGIDANAWQSMPPDVKQAIANAAASAPPF